jgi:hypothetical protein
VQCISDLPVERFHVRVQPSLAPIPRYLATTAASLAPPAPAPPRRAARLGRFLASPRLIGTRPLLPCALGGGVMVLLELVRDGGRVGHAQQRHRVVVA